MNEGELRSLCRAIIEEKKLSRRQFAVNASVAYDTLQSFLDGKELRRRDASIRIELTALTHASELAPSTSGWPEITASLSTKIVQEFESCSLLRGNIENSAELIHQSVRDVSQSISERHLHSAMLRHVAPDERLIDNFRVEDWCLGAANHADSLSEIRALEKLTNEKLRVSVPVIEIGSIAALMAMRRSSVLRGLEIEITNYGANGAEQMHKIHTKDDEPIFAVFGVAAASLAMQGFSATTKYRMLCPVHHIKQSVLSRCRSLNEVRRVLVCQGGFAVFQAAATTLGHKKMAGALPSTIERVLVPSSNPLSVSTKLNDDEGIICYEPVAQQVRLRAGCYSLPETGYEIHIGLFANKKMLSEKSCGGWKGKCVKAFIQLFTFYYLEARRNPAAAVRLLTENFDSEFCRQYAAATGITSIASRNA